MMLFHKFIETYFLTQDMVYLGQYFKDPGKEYVFGVIEWISLHYELGQAG